MSGLDARLRRLTVVYRRPEGCPACRDWWGVVLGNDDGKVSRPPCCPDCGRCVPIASVVIVGGVDYKLI